jgi:hypothetical protein
MIIIDHPKDVTMEPSQDPGPSNVAPPTFEESADHVVLDFLPQRRPDIEESPPEFTPYQADFIKLNNGWIISHDPHLNQDGPS